MATAAPPQRAGQQRRPSKRVQQARFRRALVLVLGTLVLPGVAQYVAGNRVLGRTAMQVWAVLVGAVAAVIWLVPLDTIASLAVRPWLLVGFKIAAFAIAIGWIALLIDAWRLGDPPSLRQEHRLLMLGLTLVLVGLIATPFWMATRYATAAHEAVVALFPSGQVAAKSDGRLNILLLGTDAGDTRIGTRPDSINVVSVDVRTGAAAIIGVPRNLEAARFPDGTPAAAEFPRGFTGDGDRIEWMINATWTYGENHAELFPDTDLPGAEAVLQAVSGTLDLPVHYYVIVDMVGFSDLIDAVGGVTLRVEEDIIYGLRDQGRIEAGLRTLDGKDALWYARSRTNTSDYDRMERQRCVIGAMARELDPGTVLQNFTALAEASESMVVTDIPQQQLPELVEVAWKAKNVPITSLQLAPPLIVPADPDLGVIRSQVGDALSKAREAALAAGQDEPDGTDDAGAGDESTRDDSGAAESEETDDADTNAEGAGDAEVGGDGDDEATAPADQPAAVAVNEVCSYD